MFGHNRADREGRMREETVIAIVRASHSGQIRNAIGSLSMRSMLNELAGHLGQSGLKCQSSR